MGRINGENSDYVRDGNKIVPVKPFQPLDLRLFICPYNQPNKLEPLIDPVTEDPVSHPCTGVDDDCPHNPEKSGHALIHLQEGEGISLVTDNNNELKVDQDGKIQLNPSTGGSVEIKGKLKLIIGSNTLLEVGEDNEVLLRSASGAQIKLNQDGSVDITPNSSSINLKGNVEVTGNVAVTGNITATGTITPST